MSEYRIRELVKEGDSEYIITYINMLESTIKMLRTEISTLKEDNENLNVIWRENREKVHELERKLRTNNKSII